MPFHGCRLPVNRCGNLMGRMTASFRASLAPSRPATSSHRMLGFSVRMAPESAPRSFFESASCSPSSSSLWHLVSFYGRVCDLPISTYLPPFPLPPADLPFAPMAEGFLRFEASFWFRCCLSFSARSMYSATLPRIISFDFWFFSPARRQCMALDMYTVGMEPRLDAAYISGRA